MRNRAARIHSEQSHDVTLQHLLLAGAAALPAVRYATACIAIVAAAMIAVRTTSSIAITVFGGTVMLASMVLVALVARLATGRDPILRAMLRGPAIAFAWGVVCVAIVVMGLLVSSAFWGVPNRVTCCTKTPPSTWCEPDASR